MNYYERHIGDYLKDTAHLSLLEHGIYGRLLDVYYTRESAIPVGQVERLIVVRSKDERKALADVLDEFFEVDADVLRHSRCDREIARYQDKQRKASASANARWSKHTTHTEGNADAMRTHSGGNALQTPDTSNQYKDPPPASLSDPPTKSPRASRRCPDDFAPSAELIAEASSPGVDVARELAKFRDHTFKTARSDWPATFRNWLRDAADRAKPSVGSFMAAKQAEAAKWLKGTSLDRNHADQEANSAAQLALR